ncbi:MAG: hypothetical protein WA666_11105 [Nitrospirota bacterium]
MPPVSPAAFLIIDKPGESQLASSTGKGIICKRNNIIIKGKKKNSGELTYENLLCLPALRKLRARRKKAADEISLYAHGCTDPKRSGVMIISAIKNPKNIFSMSLTEDSTGKATDNPSYSPTFFSL